MTDVAKKLADRLERLDNHLAFVVSVHLFIESLLDRLLEKNSPRHKKILGDHRTYSFAVKLMLVLHLGLIEEMLFDNIERFNAMRNEYAHDLDVDLADVFDRGFVKKDGYPLFPDSAKTRKAIQEDDPKNAGLGVLHQIREVTFDWLNEIFKSK